MQCDWKKIVGNRQLNKCATQFLLILMNLSIHHNFTQGVGIWINKYRIYERLLMKLYQKDLKYRSEIVTFTLRKVVFINKNTAMGTKR